jgi:hypothetical protein
MVFSVSKVYDCLAHVYYYERAPAHVRETCVYKGVVTLYHFTAKLSGQSERGQNSTLPSMPLTWPTKKESVTFLLYYITY